MDTYFVYNKIKMSEDSYIYHYLVMSFRLINVDITCQRMVNKLFDDMIGDMMEAYVIYQRKSSTTQKIWRRPLLE